MPEEGSNLLVSFVNVFIGLLLVGAFISVYVGSWRMIEKAGRPGWSILVPIYSQLILLDIVEQKRSWIWLWAVFVLFTTVPFDMFVGHELAKRFNRSAAFGVIVCGLFPLIGYTIIGFDRDNPYTPLDSGDNSQKPSNSPQSA